jgi:glyoxylase-like metal-dependent hydrolase (beta-lactamase superfamily II)
MTSAKETNMSLPRRPFHVLSAAVTFVVAVASAFATAIAQTPPTPPPQGVPENSVTRVSEHVYAIVGNPNIGIVIGNRATLVVDTGLGARSGAIVVREVEKLTSNPKLFLTTTHFHPEHATGEQSFPAHTILIRPVVQQEEMNRRGAEFIDMFRGNSARNKELLQDVRLRTPDITFDREMRLDLGGIHARLSWFGPAHTQGDEVIFVEEDSVLIPGDIVQNKLVPSLFNEDASAVGWLSVLDKLEPLRPRFVVPDHGPLGDGSLIGKERAFLLDLQRRAVELKRQGTPVEDAARLLTTEFKAKYPDWMGFDGGIPRGVRRVYAESQ